MPTIAEEDAKRPNRERDCLVGERTRIVNFSGIAGEHESSAAAELVAWHPDVIVAMGTIDARPVLALTRTVPTVVVTAADPVAQGLGASLARPGGNVTGTALGNRELFRNSLNWCTT